MSKNSKRARCPFTKELLAMSKCQFLLIMLVLAYHWQTGLSAWTKSNLAAWEILLFFYQDNKLKLIFHLQMLNWIKENRQEFLLNYSEIGHDSATAEELEEDHRNFESSCMVGFDRSILLVWQLILDCLHMCCH